MFLKNRNISSKIKRSKVTDYAALKGGCRGSPGSTLVKMPHCWKSHVAAHLHVPIVPEAVHIVTVRTQYTPDPREKGHLTYRAQYDKTCLTSALLKSGCSATETRYNIDIWQA